MRIRSELYASLIIVVVWGLMGAAPASRRLPGHMLPSSVMNGALPLETPNQPISLAVRLKTRHPEELESLIERLYTPGDPLYGKFLSSREFMERFGASQSELKQVIRYFHELGCGIGDSTGHERLLLNVQCSQQSVERAFQIRISRWLSADRRMIQSIDNDPSVPGTLPVEAIHGLTSVPRPPQYLKLDPSPNPSASPQGSGPNGGLAPSDIRTAYNLNSVHATGDGQTLALFELDGYDPADVAAYQKNFSVPAVPLSNVLVGGFTGTPGEGAPEVTLDIELMNAVAPGASKILVYEGPNTDEGVVETYQKIASDNLAKQVSTSWGIPEKEGTPATITSENKIFAQMAAQGQALFSASGDSGAFDDLSAIEAFDPASQPYVTGVGGTTLTMNSDHSYHSETTWWFGANGSGGGISSLWPIPSWQAGLATSLNLGSLTQRNVPDVSLNADPQSGYAIYVGAQWNVYGGTSCAAPIWAAFMALVNEDRVANRKPPLGFANPALYAEGKSTGYPLEFHDIADQSTNGHYPAVSGYDLATGWGTLDGAALFKALSALGVPHPSENYGL